MNRAQFFALAGLLLLSTSMAACGDNRSEEQKLLDAELKLEQMSYRSAVIDLRNVLRGNPSSLPARLGLARALERLGDATAAEKEIARAVELGATPDQYFEILAGALDRRGAHAELLAEINPALVKDAEVGSTLHALRGRAMLAIGSEQEAASVFDEVLAAGESVEAQRIALLGKAGMASKKADFDGAIRLAKKSLDIAPDSAESFLQVGQFLVVGEKFEEAKAFLTDENASTIRMGKMERFRLVGERAQTFLGLNDLEAADAEAVQLEKIAPDHPMSGYLRGRIAYQRGDNDAALEYLQGVGAKYPRFVPVQALLGAVSLKRQEFEQAEVFLSNAISVDPNNATARRLLAETRMRMRRPEEAAQTLRDGLRNDEANPQLLAMLGRATVQLGQQDAGVEFLKQSLAADPSNSQASIALAAAYVAQGNNDAAVALIEGLPANVIPEERRQLLLVVSRYNKDDPGPARAKLNELLQASPDDVGVLSLAGSFYFSDGDVDSARQQYERILELEPDNRAALFAILRADEAQSDYSRSKVLFEQARQRDSKDIVPPLALARLAEQDGQHDKAIDLIREANQIDDTALLPNVTLFGEALRLNDLDTADRYAQQAVTHHSDSAQAQGAVGLLQLRRGEFVDAVGSLRRATEIDGANFFYHYQLARAQLGSGQLAQARDSFQASLARNAAHLPSLRALTVLEVRSGNNGRADDLLRSAKKAHGDGPLIDEMTGDVRAAQEKFAEALQAYLDAQSEAPSWSLAAKVFQMRSKTAAPNPTQSLEKWLQDNPNHLPARLLLAQAYQKASQNQKAIEQYEMLVVDTPDSALALNNLAWLYFTQPGTENRVRALEVADKAYRLAPTNPDVADTFGWIQVKSGQLDNGMQTLREAMTLTTPRRSPDIAYHLAAALVDAGNTDEARETLLQALATTRSFGSRGDAQALLDSL
ncbi:MAG: XrtA/PEP-CTERM system TPR-repeat protein PrsT [Gammaproteobacteria bacterium]